MNKKYFLIVLSFVFLQFAGFVHGAIPASERAALIALYNNTDGDRWRYNFGWKTPPLHTDGFAMPGTEGSWYGITVLADHVDMIDMFNDGSIFGNNLTGRIPSELGNLSMLTYLDLEINTLEGNIPPALGNLKNLTDLRLNRNHLVGSIPPELGNLSNLQYLDLGSNPLSGRIPTQLGLLNKLEYLSLNLNKLSGNIPSELGNLSSLRDISLSFSNLSGSIPPELGKLSKLRTLTMTRNQLSGTIPPELGKLSNLEFLDLSVNQLSGDIPAELGELSSLTYLILDSNQLSGSIPAQLSTLNELKYLSLSYNQLSGSIPPQLGNLSILHVLSLDHNQLHGNIPSELGNLSELACLLIQKNQLSGEIPSSLMNLTGITNFNIGYNCLSATNAALRVWLASKQPSWETHQDQCGGGLPEQNPPFGSFDTPMDRSTVAGSIAVTGWTLDDGGIEGVKIYLLGGNTSTYIGDALFVEGARPDVVAAYPEYPSNTKAGWGYMMLTNFLPDGQITLTAIATDLVGKTTVLGTKTIMIDNTHAVKPFGAIDSPTQVGRVFGKSYRNNGWALTPMPNQIATNGSTIDVFIDGVMLGHVTYNLYRQDIAELFPGYANSNNAWGYYDFDTLKYKDGLHTIQWIATDNAGNTDGIGSRYFTIQNYHEDNAQYASTQSEKMNLQQISTLPEYSSEPLSFSTGCHGKNECLGNSQLTIKELERVEIQLGQNYTDIQGYLISGNILNPLPIGSTLDAKCGIFSWSPGPGFLGRYVLIFVLTDVNGLSVKKTIEIEIEPMFNN